MKSTLPDEALNQIFGEARTHSAWLEKPVSDEVLRQLHDLMKWGPTSANGSPAFRTEFYPTYDYRPIWEAERKKAQ